MPTDPTTTERTLIGYLRYWSQDKNMFFNFPTLCGRISEAADALETAEARAQAAEKERDALREALEEAIRFCPKPLRDDIFAVLAGATEEDK